MSRSRRIRPLIVVSSLFASGCITTHYGNEQTSAEKDYVVSCAEDNATGHEAFAGVVCSVENTSSGWLTFEVAKTYDMDDFAAAFDDLEHATTSGKLVMKVRP